MWRRIVSEIIEKKSITVIQELAPALKEKTRELAKRVPEVRSLEMLREKGSESLTRLRSSLVSKFRANESHSSSHSSSATFSPPPKPNSSSPAKTSRHHDKNEFTPTATPSSKNGHHGHNDNISSSGVGSTLSSVLAGSTVVYLTQNEEKSLFGPVLAERVLRYKMTESLPPPFSSSPSANSSLVRTLKDNTFFHNASESSTSLQDEKDFSFLSEQAWSEFTEGYDKVFVVSVFGAQGIGKSTTLSALLFGENNKVLPTKYFPTSSERTCTKGLTALLVPAPDQFKNPHNEGLGKVGIMFIDAEGLFSKTDRVSARGIGLMIRLFSISNLCIHVFNNPDYNHFRVVHHVSKLLTGKFSAIFRKGMGLKPTYLGYWINALRVEEIQDMHDLLQWFPYRQTPECFANVRFALSPLHPIDDPRVETYLTGDAHRAVDRQVRLNPHDVRYWMQESFRSNSADSARTPAQIYELMALWNQNRGLSGLRLASLECHHICSHCGLSCQEPAGVAHTHRIIEPIVCGDVRAQEQIVCPTHNVPVVVEPRNILWRNVSCPECNKDPVLMERFKWVRLFDYKLVPLVLADKEPTQEFRAYFAKRKVHGSFVPDTKTEEEEE